MYMDQHAAIELLRTGPKGTQEWNRLKLHSPPPSLAGVTFGPGFYLRGIDFAGCDLQEASFGCLSVADSNFARANLAKARFGSSFEFDSCSFVDCILDDAFLGEGVFRRCNFTGAHFQRASGFWVLFSECLFRSTIFCYANLRGPIFTSNVFIDARVEHSLFQRDDTSNARCLDNVFWRCTFEGTDMSSLPFAGNLIASDLSVAAGSPCLMQVGPSDSTVQSILSIKQELLVPLLRGSGLQDAEIAHFQARAGRAIEFYRCFVSSSDVDEAFAGRLYEDLQQRGIRCWKWNHDARTGRDLWAEIDNAIRVHEKVILVASQSSLASPAVLREIERALRREDERRVDVLFPIALDDYVFRGWEHQRKDDVVKKVVAHAQRWRDQTAYSDMLTKLIADLQKDA